MCRGTLLLVFVAGLVGCADMRSVRAVSAVGQSLAPFDADVRAVAETCQLERSLRLTRKCPVLNAEWSSVLVVLVRYSDELSRAAGDPSIATKDAPWPPWQTPIGDRKPDVAQFGAAVRDFLSRDASQSSVALAVNQTDSSLQSVVERFIGWLELARNDLLRVRCTVACHANAPLDGANCPSITPEECNESDEAKAAALADLALRMGHRDQALAELTTNLRAFARAHHQLAIHTRELTSRATYEAVVSGIKDETNGTGDGGTPSNAHPGDR